ncbi:Glycerate-and formate-dehydrogenase [Lasiodiplodia theobromae]|uniref:Glycerate-and formate-dehydrogenase n=1 Tax=Lasiodiplodia theobromae TaxID=45133 RepID=UPI0015C2EADA|nr:Glycerate-and formate-dehydrogenase [Lasiodiplodia theobromae]KAF4545431.1 Glycerate-and formate-dehydrogenase [Lasiodiplodia theobromae]
MPSFISSNPSDARPKVLVLGDPKYLDPDYLSAFKKSYDVTILPTPTTRPHLLSTTLPATVTTHGPFAALITRLDATSSPYAPFDATFFTPFLPHLRVVASGQAGADAFDVAWLTRRGVWFCNTRNAVAEATADWAVGLVLAVVRDAWGLSAGMRRGEWRGGYGGGGGRLVRDPGDLVLGVVGMGAIGRRVARKCVAAFGMRVVYYARGGGRLGREEEEEVVKGGCSAEEGKGREVLRCCETLEELLRSCDVLSLHCPLTPETEGLIGAEQLRLMKRGSFVVNTSRGGVVDEAALIEALESGHIERAGLDVFEDEGEDGKGIRQYWLESERVVVQPHVGGLTEGSLRRAQKEAFENVRSYFETGRPVAPFNELKPSS